MFSLDGMYELVVCKLNARYVYVDNGIADY